MNSADKINSELALGPKLSIINIVQYIVEDAFAARASDIHIDPAADKLVVRYRVDGLLRDAHDCPAQIHGEIISRIKIMAGMRTDEHQAAQDGRFRLLTPHGPLDVRVSIIPTYYGENAVLRLLSGQAQDFTLEGLGFSAENIRVVNRALHKPYGMILATGPTGSGKTTTLYTLVKFFNTRQASVITIEDPIEYAIAGINQIQVNSRTALTFASGLRAVLRQDPNIIMLGEIRDSETAGLAVNTALTGHLLLSTLHTSDAATTLPRLLDLKIEGYLIASTVNIAIGQRLVRKLCPVCKAVKPISPAEVRGLQEFLSRQAVAALGAQQFFIGKGCAGCGFSGYLGRIGLHEVLVPDQAIREAVLAKAPALKIRQLAVAAGMVPLIEDGFNKARAGLTSLSEILKILHE
jgi:type IV pilus assembly protein PilB